MGSVLLQKPQAGKSLRLSDQYRNDDVSKKAAGLEKHTWAAQPVATRALYAEAYYGLDWYKFMNRLLDQRTICVLSILIVIVVSLNLDGLVGKASLNMGNTALVAHFLSQRENAQQLTGAARYLREAATWEPTHNAAMWRLAYVLFHLREYEAAADALDHARPQDRPEFFLSEQSGEYHILQAILAERAQNWLLALREYRLALAFGPREWDDPLYRRYYGVLALNSGPKEWEVAERILDYLDEVTISEPIERLPRDWEANLSPLYRVGSAPTNCWTLGGLQYNRVALELGPLVPVQLSWTRVGSAGEQHIQALLAVNLAPNAGFEWGTIADQPLGYPQTIYVEDAPLENHQLIQTQSVSNTISTVALLSNSSAHFRSSYVSLPIPVQAERWYFQGSWMRSGGGHAYLGHGLRGAQLNLAQPWQYVAGNVQETEWTFHGRVMFMPPGTEQVELWMSNIDSQGRAYYDDLLFFIIVPPDCV